MAYERQKGTAYMHKAILIILALLTTLALPGCGNRMWESTQKGATDAVEFAFDNKPTARSYHEYESVPIIELNYDAADTIYSNISMYEVPKRSPVYFETFINQNNPADTSIFGKVVTDQVVERLVQKGLVIREGKPTPEEFFLPQGIDPKDYEKSHTGGDKEELPRRPSMLNGHYVIGDTYIYMSAKIYRLDDKAVIAGHNWMLPINDNTRELLPQLKKPEEGTKPTVKTTF
jgi:hypothetical protein